MPADLDSKGLAKLLTLLETAEEDIDAVSDAALKRLARLHEEAKVEVVDSKLQVQSENPTGVKIFLALRKGREQGS